jgi:hypothetical protein
MIRRIVAFFIGLIAGIFLAFRPLRLLGMILGRWR